ncbi:PAAR domain-containing protein [Acinetobacter sp.]|uniref:PAAR domain-containing protein n=1 Tax=Acinetobacter sp. TaxID=472 RepID=UPI0035B3EB1B
MAKALVTLGSQTSHGGIVTECESSFTINGIAVHLNGMKHYCPKCNAAVAAVASDQSTTVKGRAVVIAGDKTTCGATFMPNQNLVVSAK